MVGVEEWKDKTGTLDCDSISESSTSTTSRNDQSCFHNVEQLLNRGLYPSIEESQVSVGAAVTGVIPTIWVPRGAANGHLPIAIPASGYGKCGELPGTVAVRTTKPTPSCPAVTGKITGMLNQGRKNKINSTASDTASLARQSLRTYLTPVRQLRWTEGIGLKDIGVIDEFSCHC